MLPGFIPRLQAELTRLLSSSIRGDPRPNAGSSASIPQASPRLKRAVPPHDNYAALRPLAPHIAILNNPDPPATQSTLARAHAGRAPAFAPVALPWIGASLAGAMKTGGEEITRERWDEASEDVFGSVEDQGDLDPSTPSGSAPQESTSIGTSRAHIIPDWTRNPLPQGAPSVHAPA